MEAKKESGGEEERGSERDVFRSRRVFVTALL